MSYFINEIIADSGSFSDIEHIRSIRIIYDVTHIWNNVPPEFLVLLSTLSLPFCWGYHASVLTGKLVCKCYKI